ncbi:MAG: hypothetical protein M3N41_01190 [Acidobacteriota bacterium]|nr:hypothetical protein [Acidobacteriota bacterium]
MPDTNYSYENESRQMSDQASEIAKQAKDALTDTAKTVKDKTQEFGRAAVNKLEENRVSAAGALHSAATSLHENASKLPNGPDLAHSAAEKVDAVSGYLQGHDTKQMMADVEAMVKKNPMPSLLIAGGLGFLIGRTLRNN